MRPSVAKRYVTVRGSSSRQTAADSSSQTAADTRERYETLSCYEVCDRKRQQTSAVKQQQTHVNHYG